MYQDKKLKTESQGCSDWTQENMCGFAWDRDSKEKIKEKSLDATRLGEIRYQTDLTRTEKKLNPKNAPVGHKKICAVLHEIEIAENK
jgi:hypothetical protein